ncbi:MAG: 6,7-dimethyl-8-ribityllumazine synthase [Rhodocyclaceae bacterium]|nr:6,7-dimethyl-8-ribityllumazine synthase [Rhodocyclaceae bacterium]
MSIAAPRLAPDGHGLRVGIVCSRFNDTVCSALLADCRQRLLALGVVAADIAELRVPGALEIPVALLAMARSGRVDALVALGAVIRGETYHFEVVSDASAAGVLQVQLQTGVPVANGILTIDTDAQAAARMRSKGGEAAEAAVEMAVLLRPWR